MDERSPRAAIAVGKGVNGLELCVGHRDLRQRGHIDTVRESDQVADRPGNQLMALLSQQIADLTATLAAQGRAQSLEAAGKAATEAESKTRFQRFLGNQ